MPGNTAGCMAKERAPEFLQAGLRDSLGAGPSSLPALGPRPSVASSSRSARGGRLWRAGAGRRARRRTRQTNTENDADAGGRPDGRRARHPVRDASAARGAAARRGAAKDPGTDVPRVSTELRATGGQGGSLTGSPSSRTPMPLLHRVTGRPGSTAGCACLKSEPLSCFKLACATDLAPRAPSRPRPRPSAG